MMRDNVKECGQRAPAISMGDESGEDEDVRAQAAAEERRKKQVRGFVSLIVLSTGLSST